MDIAKQLVKDFVDVTGGTTSTNTVVYGTLVKNNDTVCVRIDGSDEITPITNSLVKLPTTIDEDKPDRVTVEVKNHQTVVTGNLENKSIGEKEENGMRSLIDQTVNRILLEVEDDITDLYSKLEVTSKDISAIVSAQGQIDKDIDDLYDSLKITDGDVLDLLGAMDSVSSDIKALYAGVEVNAEGITALAAGQTEIDNQITDIYAGLEVTAGEISTVVKAQENFTSFQQTLNGFSFMGNGGTVKISGGDINLTGSITWEDFNSSDLQEFTNTKTAASNAQSAANNALIVAGTAKTTANDAMTAASSASSIVNGWKYPGTTKIDGRSLVTDTVTASTLRGGSVSILDDNGNPMAVITPQRTSNNGLTIATTNTDLVEQTIKEYGGIANALDAGVITPNDLYPIRLIARSNLYLENTTDEGNVTSLQFTQSSFDSAIAVSASYFLGSGSGTDLGASNRKWKNVYVLNDSASTSDRNEKHDIEDLPEKYLDMFDDLHVYRFKLNEGTSDRYHVGFVAQDVFNDAMTPNNIDSQEFGGFVKDTDPETGRDIYMLRYSEFIGLLVAKMQQIDKRVTKLES